MMSQPSNTHLDNTGEIESSIKSCKPMKRPNIKKMQEKMSLLKANSSLKIMRKELTPGPFQKIPSVSAISPVPSSSQRLPISMPLNTNDLQEKYSRPLFSSSPATTTLSQLGHQHFDSPVSVKSLNQSVSSRQQMKRSHNSQIDLTLEEQLNNEWTNLNQQLTAKSQLNESLVSTVCDRSLHDSRIDDLDLQIQPIQRCISQEKLSSHSSLARVAMMEPYERNAQNSDFDKHEQSNEIFGDVREHLESQKLYQNYLAEQNRNISIQIQKFEWYVRDKIERTEEYMKQKMNQLEDTNGIIIHTLNDIKHMEREQPVRINENGPGKLNGFALPKVPISKSVSLVILNNALNNSQYMEQFVSEISRVVTLYVYNPRKSVKSIMTKLFTLNLLIKYCWSAQSSRKSLPEFSALTGVLRAISRLLTNYMSDRDMRREIKHFFKQIPRIYEQHIAQYS